MGAHQVDLAGAAEIVARRPARPRRSPVRLSIATMAISRPGRRIWPRSSRDELRQGRLELEADGGRHDGARRLAGEPGRRDAARASAWRAAASGTGRLDAMSRSDASITPCSQAARQHARRARPGRRPASGRAGGARRLRDGDQQGGFGGVERAAAPCRNRRRRRRARPRDCRPSAPGSGRSPAPRAWSSAIRAAGRAPTAITLLAKVRAAAGSSRRAACMESVEAPDTMRPRLDPAARRRARPPADRRPDGRRSGGPRRP